MGWIEILGSAVLSWIIYDFLTGAIEGYKKARRELEDGED